MLSSTTQPRAEFKPCHNGPGVCLDLWLEVGLSLPQLELKVQRLVAGDLEVLGQPVVLLTLLLKLAQCSSQGARQPAEAEHHLQFLTWVYTHRPENHVFPNPPSLPLDKILCFFPFPWDANDLPLPQKFAFICSTLPLSYPFIFNLPFVLTPFFLFLSYLHLYRVRLFISDCSRKYVLRYENWKRCERRRKKQER